MLRKVELGQFYTRGNPFGLTPLNNWFDSIPNLAAMKFIEPFAGSNSIVDMVCRTHPQIQFSAWSSFDIHPEAIETNLVPLVSLEKLDTLDKFPTGFDVCITNPPYLAKNSATRKGLAPDFGEYGDLFEVALDRMLGRVEWAAAIIPESFISRGIFTERLSAVVSLNSEMFDDTEFPVCIALFGPHFSSDFQIWRGDDYLGTHLEVSARVNDLFKGSSASRGFRFNDPYGAIGLWAIDDTKSASIRFLPGEQIPSSQIKNTSRSITRIGAKFESNQPLEEILDQANSLLAQYRELSQDILLTAFKGLRDDGKYRRRMDWKTANRILAATFGQLSGDVDAMLDGSFSNSK